MFKLILAALGLGFAGVFAATVLPRMLVDADVIGAFAGGFVNPYATGYALDAIFCWMILAAWVVHDAHQHGVRHGWAALLIGVVPGVASGLALYLLMRQRQLQEVRVR